MDVSLFATVAAGLESLLAGELRRLGASDVRQARAGVSLQGPLETAYRACLWSRLATRILLPVASGPAPDADQLYATARRVDWAEHLGAGGTLAVDFTGQNAGIRDTRFGAVRVKDAIVDQFREREGRRPSVETRAPDLRVNAHLTGARVTISLDLGGDSLHRRGYRTDKVQVEAPLKENLAAAVLLFAAWPETAAAGGSFVDPLCGSGTLAIEAAWMAADFAPGLLRAEQAAGRGGHAFAFERWPGHDAGLWKGLLHEARERREAGLARLRETGLVFAAADRDPRAVAVAAGCAKRAGLSGIMTVVQADLSVAEPPSSSGLLAANAPYGERLPRETDAVYRLLGERLRAAFAGWDAVVLAGGPRQVGLLGADVTRSTTIMNGPLRCTLAYVQPSARALSAHRTKAPDRGLGAGAAGGREAGDVERPAGLAPARGAEQFANRLRKDLHHIGRTMRRQGVSCYRLYDADLPDYNVAVDVYEGRVHVQEYAPPPDVPEAAAAARLAQAVQTVADVLEAPRADIVVKQRRRQRGAAQYERHAASGAFFPVTEEGLTYVVNLTDYLDTGLFLDQRLTRRLIRAEAGGRRFLNLFAYTGGGTVSAVAGGAAATTTVDLSATYLDWARRNFRANGIEEGDAHRLVQADVLDWVTRDEGRYDFVLLDPPTFSNSKRMGRASFDVQRDHADLIRLVVRRLLAPGGVLLFCSNRRNFSLEGEALADLALKDLSRATLPADFARRAAFHHVWRIQA